jgi:hypothetical protein
MSYICRGDKAFCSVECRRRQIFMDEQDAGGIMSGCSAGAVRGGDFAY